MLVHTHCKFLLIASVHCYWPHSHCLSGALPHLYTSETLFYCLSHFSVPLTDDDISLFYYAILLLLVSLPHTLHDIYIDISEARLDSTANYRYRFSCKYILSLLASKADDYKIFQGISSSFYEAHSLILGQVSLHLRRSR